MRVHRSHQRSFRHKLVDEVEISEIEVEINGRGRAIRGYWGLIRRGGAIQGHWGLLRRGRAVRGH